MEAIIIEIVEKVVFSLTAKTITDGISKVFKKTREEKIINALQKALNIVAHDNGFWKNDVINQCEDVLNILVKQIGGIETSKKKLPSYLDPKTVDCFCDCLKEDDETWGYLQELVRDYILRDIRDIDIDTNERVKKIENYMNCNNANSSINNHFLTSTPSEADAFNVIGREDDLKELWEVLSEKKHVLLTGMGGIGKTKLAQMLFHNYRDRFEEVAWIDYKEDLKHSFLSCVNVERFNKGDQNEDERWEAMKSSLLNDGKKKLVVIDNVDDDADQRPENDKELRGLTGWDNTTILLTSRLDGLSSYIQHKLKVLSKDDCETMFNHYYGGNELDPEMVGKIVELANYHTLTIELLAKGARRESLESYYKRIESGFETISRKVHTDYNDENATIVEHLKFMFDMRPRSDTDKKVLNAFAVLPVNCKCSIEEIEQWFGFKNEDLDEVIQDGWLSYDKNEQDKNEPTYSMHPLIRTIVRFDFLKDGQGKKTIAPEETTDKILEYFSKASFDIGKGYRFVKRRIDIAESVISAVVYEETEILASVFHKLGNGYYDMGDYGRALEYFEKAMSIRETKLGKGDPDTASTYNNIAGVYEKMGNYDKALYYYNKAREIREKVFGKNNPDSATTYNNMAWVYEDMGDNDTALKYCEEALKIRESILGKEHPDTATTYRKIAQVYKNKGEYEMAMKYSNEALEIGEKVLGKEHPEIAKTYNTLAQVYKNMGEYDKALNYHEKALKIRETKLSENHPDTAKTYNNIALVHINTGNYDTALEYFEKARSISETKLGKEHPSSARTYHGIARAYEAKGDHNRAWEYEVKALKVWLQKEVLITHVMETFINMQRYYEETYKGMPFEQWMMKLLNDKKKFDDEERRVLLKLLEGMKHDEGKQEA